MTCNRTEVDRQGNTVLIAVIAIVIVAGLLVWFIASDGDGEVANGPEPDENTPAVEESETVYNLAIYDLLDSLGDSYTQQQVYIDQYPPPPERAEFESVTDPRAQFVLTPYASDHPAYTAPHPLGISNTRGFSSANVIGKSCYYLLTDDRTFVIKMHYDIAYGRFGPEDGPPPNDDLRSAAITKLLNDLTGAGLEDLRIIDPATNPEPGPDDIYITCIDPVG